MSWVFPNKPSRRKQLVPPPLRHAKPNWEVEGRDKPAKPRWKVTTDRKGKQTFREMIPPPLRSDGYSSEFDRSRFSIEITEDCFVGGVHAQNGDKVICFYPAAAMLMGRGKVLSEEKNAI